MKFVEVTPLSGNAHLRKGTEAMTKYRYLKSNELIREGDERFDYEFGWTVMQNGGVGGFPMTELSTTAEQTWHKVTKFYKGGCSEFQIAIPKGIRLSKDDWEAILEWLGEHTNGGHNYSYSMKTRRLPRKSTKLPAVRYPSNLCAKLFDFGTNVVTNQKMI